MGNFWIVYNPKVKLFEWASDSDVDPVRSSIEAFVRSESKGG